MAIPYDPTRSALYTPETQDTLFETGQQYSPVQLAVEGARLAYYRAEESPAQMQRLTASLARAGCANPERFADNITGAFGFGCVQESTRTALLSLRGTQPDDISDIAHDLNAVLTPWSIGGRVQAGRVHAGFASAFGGLWEQIQKWLDKTKLDPKQLIITGHSLGAAMATLAASLWHPAWLVTLGSPRVGDDAFVGSVQAGNTLRIVDCCDVVARVPPELDGYTHLPTCTYLNRTAQVLSNPDRSLIDEDRRTAREEYLVQHAWKRGAVLVRDLADHAPINYARAFFGKSVEQIMPRPQQSGVQEGPGVER